MAEVKKELEKSVEVDVDGKKVKIVVKRPGNRVSNDAQRRGALVWTQCVREGVMTKRELTKYMKERGVWSEGNDEDEKTILDKITSLEKELYLGTKAGKIRASKGKEIAVDMRKQRIKLRDLLTERMGLEANTAESLSDNARFDYIVANCTYYENGNRVYEDLDDYDQRSDDPVAFHAASALAEMIYVVDSNFERKLPENKFLQKFNYVNDDLSLVNNDGETVDTEGRIINSEGHYLDIEGRRTDKDGHLLDEDGAYVPQVTYLDDSGKPIRDKKPAKSKAKTEEPEPKPEDETES